MYFIVFVFNVVPCLDPEGEVGKKIIVVVVVVVVDKAGSPNRCTTLALFLEPNPC